MTDKRSTFPLPLSSVTGSGGKGQAASPARVATPQTATRNAAHTAVVKPYAAPVRAASPSKSHSDAMARAQAAPPAARPDLMVSDAIRRAMVARVAKQGVQDGMVLAALEAVPRHRFIDEALSAQAYIDASLPIGHSQTISQPYIVGRMIEVMRNGGQLGRVLEIGTGCGYQAAVLSMLATEVYSIERLRGLHDKARENLRHLRLPNVHLLFGDGMAGYAKGAPYAAIIAAAGGEAVPQAWVNQLAMGGRLVAPVVTGSTTGGATGGAQALLVLDKTPQGIRSTLLEAVHFVPLKSGVA